MSPVLTIVFLVALQRLAELLYARRNTRRLLAEGAVEVGRGHYPLIVLLHLCWLAALVLFVAPQASFIWWLIGLYGVLQVGRVWIYLALGRFWTTRIITLPGAALVQHGPYRYCQHPNYLIVAAEIAVLPLAFGAWEIAIIFSLLNAAVTAWRIRVEEQALTARRAA